MGAPYMPLWVTPLMSDTAGLPLEAFGAWVKTLCIMWERESATITERSEKHWARRWGCDTAEASQIIAELEMVATIEYGDDGSVSIGSGRMQEELDTLNRKRDEGAKRKKAWRAKKGSSDGGDGENVPRSERVPNASVPRSAISLSLSDSELSERKEKTPLSIFESVTGYDPPVYYRDMIQQTVKSLDRWEAVCQQWVDSDYRPTNVPGLLELYAKTASINGQDQKPLTRSQYAGLSVQEKLERGGYRIEDFLNGSDSDPGRSGEGGRALGAPAKRTDGAGA